MSYGTRSEAPEQRRSPFVSPSPAHGSEGETNGAGRDSSRLVRPGDGSGVLESYERRANGRATWGQGTMPAPSASSGQALRAYAHEAAQRAGCDPALFERQIQQESGFDPDAYNPASGARG